MPKSLFPLPIIERILFSWIIFHYLVLVSTIALTRTGTRNVVVDDRAIYLFFLSPDKFHGELFRDEQD